MKPLWQRFFDETYPLVYRGIDELGERDAALLRRALALESRRVVLVARKA